MLRLAKFAAVLACVLGASCPSSSEAGVIPWAYDAVFGPVGSLHRSYYQPYYAGYSGYTGASYLPASYTTGYATNGCSSCQQSSYYASTYSVHPVVRLVRAVTVLLVTVLLATAPQTRSRPMAWPQWPIPTTTRAGRLRTGSRPAWKRSKSI